MDNSAKITWHIYDSGEYYSDNEYYLGTFVPGTIVNIVLQVWNNRYGQVDLEDIKEAKIVLYFDNIENSSLLNYCYISVDNETPEKIEVVKNDQDIPISAFKFLGEMSGKKNDGSESNKENFKDITISFRNLPMNLKNDLKNLFIDIEKNY